MPHEADEPSATGPLLSMVERFSDIGRELTAQAGLEKVLHVLTQRAIDVIDPAEHASVTRSVRGGFETTAATSDVATSLDQIQYAFGRGPCVDAIIENGANRSGDLAADDRWPDFGPLAASDYGINSVLSVRFFFEDNPLTAGLNLYAAGRDAFDDSDLVLANLIATHGALAITAAQRQDAVDNLNRALRTNRQIGMAIGILMATFKLTEDQAFNLLRVKSQGSHRRLADVAAEVCQTGTIDLPNLTS